MEVFNYDNKFVIIEKLEYEPRELYIKRVWFILNRMKFYENKLDDLVRFSIIWSNVKNLNCKYQYDIENELNKIISLTQ